MTRLQLQCVRDELAGVMRPMRQLRRCMQAIPSEVSGGQLEAIFSQRLQVYLGERRSLQEEEGGKRMVSWAHRWTTDRIGTAESFPQLVKTDGATQVNIQERTASIPVNEKSQTAADIDRVGRVTIQRKWEDLSRSDRLTQLLQEYERLRPQSPDLSQSVGESPTAAHPGHSVKQETKKPMEGSLSTTRWPQITGDQVATRLQAFVSGASVSASVPPVHEASNTSPTNPGAIQNSFHIQVNMRGENDHQWNSDLSEHIADVLREQAIQHGIDLT